MSFITRYSAHRHAQPLTDDQLQRLAPSIFAEAKHESRSERYTYIPTIEVVRGLRDEGFFPVMARQGNSRIPGKADYTKHLIRFRHLDHGPMYENLGDLYPEVALVNSHDGTSAYKIIAAMMRLACLNGMVVQDARLAEISVPHKGTVTDKVIEGSYTVLDESRKALEIAGEWSGKTLTDRQQKGFAEAVHIAKYGDDAERMPFTPESYLRTRRAPDQGADLWRVANRVQESAIRGGMTGFRWDEDGRNRKRVTARPVKSIDGDIKLNKAVWHLAQMLADHAA